MGRSRMNCMKITLHLLALCLLLSITTKVSGKPNPRHLLIETEKQTKAKNNDDYQNSQIMEGNIIRGGSVSQIQNNGGGLGGGSGNTQRMTNNNIRAGNIHQSQNKGGGSHNTQSMTNNNIRGGNVRQSQNNGGGWGGGWGGGSHNSQSMTGNTIDGASVSQTQNNGGGFPW